MIYNLKFKLTLEIILKMMESKKNEFIIIQCYLNDILSKERRKEEGINQILNSNLVEK